jgi:hypothetical protein
MEAGLGENVGLTTVGASQPHDEQALELIPGCHILAQASPALNILQWRLQARGQFVFKVSPSQTTTASALGGVQLPKVDRILLGPLGLPRQNKIAWH